MKRHKNKDLIGAIEGSSKSEYFYNYFHQPQKKEAL